MTIPEIAQLIGSLSTFIAAVGTLWIGIRNSQKIEVLRENTDGKLTELHNAVQRAAHAEGKAEGRAEIDKVPPLPVVIQATLPDTVEATTIKRVAADAAMVAAAAAAVAAATASKP